MRRFHLENRAQEHSLTTMGMTRWTGLLLITGLSVGVARSSEKLNRGVVAAVNSEGNVYVGWRLLKKILKM